ncbi:MAG: protein-glutamate O-methyltransferase CheR [Isosphaeraceae bacterium]
MSLSPETFDALRRVVYELCGVVITEDKEYLVTSRFEPILKRTGLSSYDALALALRQPNALGLQEQVIEAITTKETSFNRDGHPFDELRRSILPELITRLVERRSTTYLSNQKARLWCAATATGQEVYSLAMAVADVVSSRPSLGLTVDDFPILATDISQTALNFAREGRYTNAEVARGITPELSLRYFRQEGSSWVVDPQLRRMIEFTRLNLANPLPNLGAFDLILCRNLLIYFDIGTRKRLCQDFYQALNPGGLLMLGAAESIYGISDAFTTRRYGNTLVYRKG